MTFEYDVTAVAGVRERSPMTPDPFVVKKVQRETYDTFTMDLAPAKRGSSFSFSPGQFNMVYVYGVGEVPISISGDPGDSRALVHTTRAVGTVTKAMKKLKAGDMVGIRGPFGTSWPVDLSRGKDVVIVAGGIGLPPLRPAIYSILRSRESFNKVFLLYGARTPVDIMFPRQMENWRKRNDVQVHITVDRSSAGWKGNVGVVTTLVPRADFNPQNTIAMVVGPEIMMRFTTLELIKQGMDPGNIYLSMERNMKCGIGMCGHCQCGKYFVCKDGPVFRYSDIKDLLIKREI